MKLFINRLPITGPWGGGAHAINAVHELSRKFGIEVTTNLRDENIDVCLMIGFDGGDTGVNFLTASNYCASSNGKTKLVVRVNENDARKGTFGVDNTMWYMMNTADATIFVSKWLQEYYLNKYKSYPDKRAAIIYNGVNKTVFTPRPNIKLSKTNHKVNIVSAHWSDNSLKGQDVTEWLDEFVGQHKEDYTFTFVGRTKARLRHSTLVNPLFGEELGVELCKYDVSINGTRYDPGPNSVIEPISCGLPTYVHEHGGGAVEFAGKDHVFKDFQQLEDLLLSKRFENNTIQFEDWRTVISHYVDFIKSI